MSANHETELTPGQAIRAKCLDCAGGGYSVVRSCVGAALRIGGDEHGRCWLHPYRLGSGRPSVRTIRQFCLECQGCKIRGAPDSRNHPSVVADCRSKDCPLHPYRLGKNPNVKRPGRTAEQLALFRSAKQARQDEKRAAHQGTGTSTQAAGLMGGGG